MTDGPFKNLKLESRSKRFAEAVQNEAIDRDTRCAYASDAIVNGVLAKNQNLLHELQSYSSDGQLDLAPQSKIGAIFGAHPMSEFADNLQREVSLRLYERNTPQVAISNGLKATLDAEINKFGTRIQEACLKAYGNGDMRKNQLGRTIKLTNQALQDLDRPRTLNAIQKGDKGAFKYDVRKKEGINEGPKL